MYRDWDNKIFKVSAPGFEKLALEIFRFQYRHNSIYKVYSDMLKVNPEKVNTLAQIPFLPIQFFKTHKIKTTEFEPQAIFESSGTTQAANSHHLVKEIELYRQSFIKAFKLFYGPVNEWCILGLLPSYLERENSSLVFMVDELIRESSQSQSGFYLYDYEKLHSTLKELEDKKQKTLLIGVTFALLDFAELYPLSLEYTTIMETGGMKGRRKELIRNELHDSLKNKFDVDFIHSEYGMTELLSQAYSQKDGIFHCPPWMKVLIRDEEDPLQVDSRESIVDSKSGLSTGDFGLQSKRGIINVIDLANIYSCSFIATEDAGKLYADGSFEVLGRIDNSDIRGCSLMAM
jgi:hypothetical protein